ncbi:site-specific DNA-methyltransferase [Streptomyces sp. SID3343]|uniref:DNA-methyltransferase n=1 Tax=Streptomyces sp. SID3343 TaxID=2690260 RepID=UPI00136E3E33|nr:site-specific DNA-methyltransferase [Streptomyces sp. SID3343]MYW03363.1 site-specific DNA-methyltransferase [Streptomyces sp. SID3343]MYW06231.1 site-specific DNA-methyltransferase [Streptomyces sp. SID3343]
MPYALHRGDALSVLSGLPDESVDALVTDPPYNSGGRTSMDRTTRSARSKYTSEKGGLPDFGDENKDQRSFTRWMTEILRESYRVTVPTGTAIVFIDWRQLPSLTDAMQMAGWTWRGVAAWHKPASRPQKGRIKQSCEFIVWGSKGAVDASRNPVYLPGLYTASQPRKDRKHITQKPLSVMRELVTLCPPGGVVLDPFAGSGTTGVAALMEGRRFIGVEYSPQYADIAEARLAEAAQYELAA